MATGWYVPSFGYAVTRPYPYKWFPWVVLVGGIFSLVLFSAINLAANGYDLNVQYTTDPNSTVSQTKWAERWPFSWFSKVDTTCQSLSLQINSQFSTDKLGFFYTLTSIGQYRDPNGPMTTIPSLRYTNNTLQHCSVNEIVLNIESWKNQTETMMPGATVGVEASRHQDITLRASLLSLNSGLRVRLNRLRLCVSLATIIRLRVLRRSPSDRIPISGQNFFSDISSSVTCVANHGRRTSGEYNCFDTSDLTIPRRWLKDEADHFAKVFYSALLADLGIISSDNILTNASLLQEYTQALKNTPQNKDYKVLVPPDMSPLNITPSTIYAEYLCQVPQRKPIGPLLVSIFVADLVLLQAVWKILNWATTAWTERNQHQAKFCEGCLATMARGTYGLSSTAPANVSQESSHVLSEMSVTSPRGSLREHHGSESRLSLVSSPSSLEPE
ncbi:hypothetical protein MMC07_007632 [Pseudocyphellaria aurata]|nr:hypothetical protein [Pseudocyphellaria aurata]